MVCYQRCSAWEVTVRWPWCGGPLATDAIRKFVVFSRPSLPHSERLSGDSDLQLPSPLNPRLPAHTCCFPGNRAGAPLVWPGRLPLTAGPPNLHRPQKQQQIGHTASAHQQSQPNVRALKQLDKVRANVTYIHVHSRTLLIYQLIIH